MSESWWMMARRVAFLAIVALAVFLAGSGVIFGGVALLPNHDPSYEAIYGIVKGSLLLVSAAAFARGAWCLRGQRRPEWLLLGGWLIVGAAALWAYFSVWGSDQEPTQLSRGKFG